MRKATAFLILVSAWLLALPALAAQQGIVVQSCGSMGNKNVVGGDGPIAVDVNGNLCTGGSVPTSAASAGISSKTITNATVSSLVLKASSGNFYGAQFNTGASAVWVLLIDGTSDPGNGTNAGCGTGVHAAGCVAKWWQVPANSTLGVSTSPPIAMTNGAVLICSTTGPFIETQSATCLFSGEIQ